MMFPKALQELLNKTSQVIIETYHPFRHNLLYDRLFYKMRRKDPSITHGKISNVLNTFHELIFQEILNNRQGVLLPYQLGKVCIISKDVPYHQLKWNKQAYETNGKNGIILYDNDLGIQSFTDRSMWIFYIQRPFEKRIIEKYKEDYMFYMNAFKQRKWWKNFVENPGKKTYIPREKPDILENYNEFEF